MLLSAACSLVLFVPQAQEPQDPPPLLKPNETTSLHEKIRDWIEAELRYDESEAGARPAALRAKDKAKDTFQKEWDRLGKDKGDLLKSVADLRDLFDNVFKYERKSGQGSLTKMTPKDYPPYFNWLPKTYKNDVPMRIILLVPGFDEKLGTWQEPRTLFTNTWEGSATAGDSLFHVPVIDKKWLHELDRFPDYTRPGEDVRESERIQELFKSFGETTRTYNFDRRRQILDCGRESSGFGMRLACHFPDRFAGIIVRWPVEMKDTRLGSLTGVPILLISSPATAAACTSLKERLEKLGKGAVTEIAATDEYPYKASTPDVEKWLQGVQRNLVRTKVVIEPNDDRYKQAFWAGIDTMDQVATAPADKKPRLEVTADRANNRIEVKATAVESFILYLNDSLVDLGKPFTVVINGKAKTEQRTRDFGTMKNLILKKFDGNWVFPVMFGSGVPQEEKPAAGGGSNGGAAASGK